MTTVAYLQVRINSALALTCIKSRDQFGPEQFTSSCVSTCKALESSLTNVEDADEIQHRTELIDQLCLTFSHLVALSDDQDFARLEESLGDYADLLESTMKTVMLRISPEKATGFVNARRKLLDRQTSLPIKFSEHALLLDRLFVSTDHLC